MKHPGTPILYDLHKPVAEGGLPFRANWGVEYNGETLLAPTARHQGQRDRHRLPGVRPRAAEEAGLVEPTSRRRSRRWPKARTGRPTRVGRDHPRVIAHGCAPYGNARARCNVWNFPDPVPTHREPLVTPRRDLVAKYPTYDDKKAFWRLPTLYKSVQAVDFSKQYPLIMTSGRLVEYEGGGDETRSNPWLAELQQTCSRDQPGRRGAAAA
jgi:formate dehydrogenase major subunit